MPITVAEAVGIVTVNSVVPATLPTPEAANETAPPDARVVAAKLVETSYVRPETPEIVPAVSVIVM
jgi:hypothetical protein